MESSTHESINQRAQIEFCRTVSGIIGTVIHEINDVVLGVQGVIENIQNSNNDSTVDVLEDDQCDDQVEAPDGSKLTRLRARIDAMFERICSTNTVSTRNVFSKDYIT